MSKLRAWSAACAIGAVLACAPVSAQPAGACSGDSPAILVNVIGLKSRDGLVRVQSYGGDPSRWFDKGTYLRRVEVPAGRADQICMPVPGPGLYAVSVRHDANGNGKSDRSDGGGMSGNPDVTLLSVILKRKPPAAKVQVRVGSGATSVQVVMNYVRGGSFEPVQP